MAKDKRPIKEFEAVPNPWKAEQKPVKVEFNPKQGPKGRAVVKKEKAAEPPKPEKPKPAKEKLFTDEQFLEALKQIGHPASSREISDKLGIQDPEYGRALVRREMEWLASQGKVKITEAEKGRAARLYSLA